MDNYFKLANSIIREHTRPLAQEEEEKSLEEGAIGTIAGGIAGAALGGPLGALTGAASGKYLTDDEEVRSLDGFFADEEIDIEVEDDEGLKKLGLTDDDINAVNVAKKLATQAGGLGAAKLTQNRTSYMLLISGVVVVRPSAGLEGCTSVTSHQSPYFYYY